MHLIAHLIHEYGLIAVATIVALECVGFPVPGETALLGAAIDAGAKHDLNIGAVIIVAAGAAIVGRMMPTTAFTPLQGRRSRHRDPLNQCPFLTQSGHDPRDCDALHNSQLAM